MLDFEYIIKDKCYNLGIVEPKDIRLELDTAEVDRCVYIIVKFDEKNYLVYYCKDVSKDDYIEKKLNIQEFIKICDKYDAQLDEMGSALAPCLYNTVFIGSDLP